MSAVSRVVFVLAVGALACPPTAYGQPVAPREYHGIFDTTGDPNARESLNVLVTLAEVYDSDLLADRGFGRAAVTGGGADGFYSDLAPSLTYAVKRHGFEFTSGVDSRIVYYREVDELFAPNNHGNAAVSFRLNGSTRIGASQSISYAPSSFYGLLAPHAVSDPALDGAAPTNLQTFSRRALAYVTSLDLTHELSGRTSLGISGDFRQTRFTDVSAGREEIRAYGVRGNWSRDLDQRLKLRLGYRYNHSQYSADFAPREQRVEIGFEYTKPISATRNWSVRANLAPTVVSGLAADTLARRRTVTLAGDASVDRQVGRSWTVVARYNRTIEYIAGLSAPARNTGGGLQVTGFANRRISVSLSLSDAKGTLMSPVAPQRFSTYSADAQVQFALTAQWAWYAEGILYQYDFDRGAVLVGLPRTFSRNQVRAGLRLWVPARSR